MKGFSILICLAVVAGIATALPRQDSGKKLICYYGSWSVYRPGAGQFQVEDIDPMMCTHIIYGFAGIETDGTLKILDPWNELEENWGRGAMRRFTNLKQQNPDLKALLAIGGWTEGSEKYSDMALTQASRKKFIDSVIPFLQLYNFDGFDLDWEYPTQRGGKPEDRQNFVSLTQEMKAAFQPLGLLLTAAVSAGVPTIEEAYDVPAISNSLDFINVMAYDLHGAWETFTHHNSPIDAMPLDTGNNTHLNVKAAIEFWISQGADPNKLVLGMGTYGRGFLLDDPQVNDYYAPASAGITAGPYTRESGIWGYNEVLEKFAQQPNQWKIVRNSFVGAPYAVNGREWISYDDVESIQLRVAYALEKGLGGGMFWSIETDDFHGTYSSEAYPLIKAARRALGGEISTPRPTTPTVPTTVDPTAPPPTTVSTGPTTTRKPGDQTCHEAGSMPDTDDCTIFFVCVPLVTGDFDQVTYHCPAGTIYDPNTTNCNWFTDVPGAIELCGGVNPWP